MTKETLSSNISLPAEIICDRNSKITSLKVNTSGNWKLFAGTSVDNIDMSMPIIEGNSKGVIALSLPTSRRHYFLFNYSSEKVIISEKLLPMAGAHNLRDLGGVKTIEGKYVKWGKLFRGGELGKLTKEDQEYLNSISIKTIIDFRDYSEIEKMPDIELTMMNKRYHLPLAPGNLAGNTEINHEKLFSYDAHEIMINMYSEFISDPKCLNSYRQFFELIQNEDNLPLIYHCTAGKDRTGVATALIYAALGVDIESILNDYMLSNGFLEEKYRKVKNEHEFFKILLEVTPDFLLNTVRLINNNYSSIENFLIKEMSVDINKMKQIYLY
ncbi:tyrosine-protein phosphatase [Bacteroidales bacterium OttesenSCG-928-K03]|nr:tyrosine-protein phosphatase [Odoribacter sp. OttesenSCG-928-L07]MDL2238799.1 tyrosine-protein phosphatase [Bacteroidales bacterium OttesenSCG-928-L14]MDL2240784.1 tyrosine-protein phosphatase [Bacteroidales bacterium OttesenSCG-928-K22]MDL2242178.1 tyrosine-protein phosphatase [Bacteroidales bacterium OttesenSCG-928-K03]